MDILEFPGRAVSGARAALVAPIRPLLPADQVDDWGRDGHLIRQISPLLRTRWDVRVGGEHHLPARAGALLVTNNRRFSASPIYVAWALGEATERPVRFVGRTDVAPLGAVMRRVGGLLNDPAEVRGALRHGEIVVLGAAPTKHPRFAGAVDAEIVGAAIDSGVSVHAVASTSNPLSRSARAEVGPAVRLRRKRRGPLAAVELAEAVQRRLQKMLDELGGVRMGVTPSDWVAGDWASRDGSSAS